MRKRWARHLVYLAFCLLILASFLLPLAALADSPTTVNYTPLMTDIIPNPERGFYHHLETFSSAHVPLDVTTLQTYRQDEQITLILRLYYLDSFTATNLTAAYLNLIQQDLATVRQAGLKVILRFAYSQNEAAPNNEDASLNQVLLHLAALEPVIRDNSDVIAVVQAGFIGAYGEWYYAHPDFGPPAAPNYTQRGAVLTQLLQALPAERMVQLRTPYYKQNLYGTGSGAGSALPADQAYNGTNIARTGHHNDCFLASADDFGTYLDIAADQAYLAAETSYLPMGGETCLPNPPRSGCPTALAELERFHWSYLNWDYEPGVLDSWLTGGCLDEIQRRLGYRFVLQQGSFANQVKPGQSLEFTIILKNEGWAAPFNPRPVELLLRHTVDQTLYVAELPDDPRFWLAGPVTYGLSHTLGLPAGMPLGAYELLLNLPDPAPLLHERPDYALRLANEGVWEATTGYNNLLHTLIVSPTASGDGYTGSLTVHPTGLTGGLVVTPTGTSLAVVEGGAAGPYQVALPKAPIQPVTIELTTDGQTIVSPAVLTFDSSTWQTPQTITLLAVADAVDEGQHVGLITHTFTSADSAYGGLSPVIVVDVSEAGPGVYLPVILKS